MEERTCPPLYAHSEHPTREDPHCATFLEQVGDGTLESDVVDLQGMPLHVKAVRLPDELAAPMSWQTRDLLDWVYGGMIA